MNNFTEYQSILEKYNFWQNSVIEYGFKRDSYLKKIDKLIGNSLVKVIVGQRRSGKSRLMRMMIEHLMHNHQVPAKNILYINKELHDFNFIENAQNLIEVFQLYLKTQNPTDKIYFFIDEIQEITSWEKAINSLCQDYRLNIELFITGSNANLLSGELATYLSGRYLTLTVYPFSYTEFLEFFALSRNKASVLKYIEQGGLPEMYTLEAADAKQNYVQSLLDSIVLRDIVRRHHIRDVALLNKIISFAIDSIGSMLSIASIIKTLAQHKYKTNAETLSSYLELCQQAFFIHECKRYDVRGKEILIGERKYYLNDLAFKVFYQSGYDNRISRLLENVVYLSLLRKGYTVYVGRYQDKEVDFVCEKNGEKCYIQVAYLLADEAIIKREFTPLLRIQDNYPKLVLSLDEISLGNIQGINHQFIWDFL